MANTQIRITVGKLRTAQYNPRKWSKEAVDKLTESIERFGFVDPIIVNSAPGRKNIVIGGHFRLYVAKQLGMTEVPVVYVNIPEEEREKELNLRLNRNTGEWDLELLKEFDIPLLLDSGFNDLDLGNIWDSALSVDDDHFNVGRLLANKEEVMTQLGDVIRLGRHVLICAEPTQIDSATLKIDTPIKALLVDLPTKARAATAHDAIEKAISAISSDAHIFTYCQTQDIGELQRFYSKSGIDMQDVCFWVRPQHSTKSKRAFISSYQPCLYGTIGKPAMSELQVNGLFNQEIGNGSKAEEDTADIFNIWLARRDTLDPQQRQAHKPPTLHEKLLRRCTQPGDTILHLFAEVGSLMAACEQLQRQCFMVEPDPKRCDIIRARYEALTSKAAQS